MNGLKIKMNNPKKNTLFGLLKPYSGRVSALLSLALLSNGLSLIIPKIIQKGIDDYSRNIFNAKEIIFWFGAASVVIFILSYIQAVLQTFISERVAFDLRSRLSYKISLQNYHYIRETYVRPTIDQYTSDTGRCEDVYLPGNCFHYFFRSAGHWRRHPAHQYQFKVRSDRTDHGAGYPGFFFYGF